MSDHQPLQELQAYLDYLRFEKRYALPTIESYASDLNFLFIFLKEQYECEGLPDIQAPMIRGWLASMKEVRKSRPKAPIGFRQQKSAF
jgi:integrase/recombinase XerC